MRKSALLAFALLNFIAVDAQQKKFSIQLLQTGQKASFRGLSVVNDRVLWVSGSGGSVGRSTDGGHNWTWFKVPGHEKTDFRDIEAFDENIAVIMGIGEPAYILRTTNGGKDWSVVYENKTKGMFLDAMAFRGADGIVVGDPIDDHFFVAITSDSGKSWKPMSIPFEPAKGEAFFAASGTNVLLMKPNTIAMVSGGTASHFYTLAEKRDLPVIQGKESTGANSIALSPNGKKWIVVGGDFANDSSNIGACFYSTNGGRTWQAPEINVHGYRSCVDFISNKEAISCGTKGVDYTCDGGKTWTLISNNGFHVCQMAKNGTAVFLAGGNGRIGKLVVE